METVLWILLWVIGCPIMYGVIFLLHIDGTKWDNSNRLLAAFWSLFSWLGIALIIFLATVVLAGAGGAWLTNKTITPILEKYETRIDKLEAWIINLFKKKN